MKLCDNPDCVQVSIVDVDDPDSGTAVSLCEECLAERYGVHLCSDETCKQPAVLAITIKPDDQDELVTLYFCEACKEKPVQVRRPVQVDWGEELRQLVDEGSPPS